MLNQMAYRSDLALLFQDSIMTSKSREYLHSVADATPFIFLLDTLKFRIVFFTRGKLSTRLNY